MEILTNICFYDYENHSISENSFKTMEIIEVCQLACSDSYRSVV